MSPWRATTDRLGQRWYVLADGTQVGRDGFGRMCWSVYYRDHMRDGIPSHGMTDTLREAQWWGVAY